MTTTLQIRRAVEADVPGIVESAAGLSAEDAGLRDPAMNLSWAHTEGTKAFAEGLRDPNRLLLVADFEGQVRGHLIGLVTPPTSMRPARITKLLSLFVFPEYRDSGVGARLVDAFIEWAHHHDTEYLQVTAYAANSAAMRFYERHGFTSKEITLERRA